MNGIKRDWRGSGSAARKVAVLCSLLACFLLLASEVRAGNVFDDDWTPPAPHKPVQPPTEHDTAKPPVQPVPSEPAPATPPPAIPPPDVSASTPSSRPSSHHAVPGRDEQARSRKAFKELFAKELADRSAAARRVLAAKLLDQAVKITDAPTDQFVLLMGASDAGKDGGDLRVCMRAAEALAASYDVDGPRIAFDAASKMNLRSDSPAVSAENCRAGLELVDKLVEDEDYLGATHLLSSLRSIAPPSSTVGGQIQTRIKELDTLRSASDKLTVQLEKLKSTPDDPAANLAVGRFFCLMKGDWDHGLPMLAKGSDLSLKVLAEADLAKPTGGVAACELADKWWSASDKETVSLCKSHLKARAAFWYKASIATLSGLSKLRAGKRIAEAAASGIGVQVANETDAPEASAVFAELSAKYPDLLADANKPTLVKYHDAAQIKNGSYRNTPGSYSAKSVACSGGGITFCCLYEDMPAGRYLIVYRLQALTELSGDNVCFIDVCSNGNTIAGKHPGASDLKPGHWVAYPDPLTLKEKAKIEYRFWASEHSFAVDRIYIYRLGGDDKVQ